MKNLRGSLDEKYYLLKIKQMLFVKILRMYKLYSLNYNLLNRIICHEITTQNKMEVIYEHCMRTLNFTSMFMS